MTDWSVNAGQHRVNELFEQMLTRCDAIVAEVQAMQHAVRQMQAQRIKHNVDRVLFPPQPKVGIIRGKNR